MSHFAQELPKTHSPAAENPPHAPDRRLTTTVPREYVHRAAVSEVFLTGWEAVAAAGSASSAEFVVRAQWPRSHSLFAREDDHQDPMLMIESARQVGSLLAHTEFGVPFGHHFLMANISIAVEPELLVMDTAPTEIELLTECRDIVRRDGALTRMRYGITVLRRGMALGTAEAAFRCIGPDVYQRLRGNRPTSSDRPKPPAVEAALVGRTGPRHVVLGELASGTAGRWELRVDTAHPTYFDHPVDHIPGMVLLEAARQAAHAVVGLPDALVLGVTSAFSRYAEFDAPCWIEARVESGDVESGVRVRVEGVQRDATVFVAEVLLRPRTH
ncbi:ScbA/BarX family gamma-butyrolactone biosynthesis protein [Streptomyces sp. NPDC050549]|uniref:ScbA/BarX family gamma-butyrolactone biosynthesis protein n=1 Tax=Streptomyces sp. NPDC050549 TaxID=3155406 RepID=UPI00342DA0A8